MTGKGSRTKGARGERELAGLIGGRRTGQMQSQTGAPEADVEGLAGHFTEVKRRERVEIEKWCKETELSAPDGLVPIVIWRRNHQPWRVTLLLDDYLKERG